MFKNIVSNNEAKNFLVNELKLQKKSGTYLFYGTEMEFLTEFALCFAKGLLCQEIEFDFCDNCNICRRINSTSYSDLEILSNPDGLKVDEIRELAQKSASSSYEGGKKIFILKDIGKMKKEASNALLKLIEEPHSDSFFILLNTSLNILPTIKSRAILVKIKKKTATELDIDDFTYNFFMGITSDIEKFKLLNLDLNTGYSYSEIKNAIKKYDETRDFSDKINIYKGIRDFINNRNSISNLEKILFAEEILRGTSDKNLHKEIVTYFINVLGDIEGLEKRLELKSKLRFPINMKLLFIELFSTI